MPKQKGALLVRARLPSPPTPPHCAVKTVPFVLEVFSGGKALTHACGSIGIAACTIGLHNISFSDSKCIQMDLTADWAQKVIID